MFINKDVCIGDYSYVYENTLIESGNIGKFCSIASNVSIGPDNHPINLVSTHPFLYDKKWSRKINIDTINYEYKNDSPPIIGNDVWIGRNAIILRNVTIGDGAIIGAGAVVTKDVEAFSIVGGVPARHIKYRFPEEIREKLLQIKWWDWPEEKIRENIELFYNVEKFIKKFYHSGENEYV
ncbi:CatB-related O-acetyltransferase [Thermoanaerobacterium sp. CMT5567-10]|uniref:CatB-related O-acetyltransferase n=1 Tax=Thermoanaerobacterium sp. CMT5567-10 TaxID=3061989 RepID=UPI0026DF227D|nr:CatB-related O-acetyltransferase [Thermoanaerobacterium sp. CMT5567-10]WKV08007.1 CatB-related O-acetyltransferase [Thermoanaerobacterium sp. CMT5567-10]